MPNVIVQYYYYESDARHVVSAIYNVLGQLYFDGEATFSTVQAFKKRRVCLGSDDQGSTHTGMVAAKLGWYDPQWFIVLCFDVMAFVIFEF
jgi:hypothetical protein